MFSLLLLLLALHAIIHLLGAFKAFGWSELEALPLAISPGMGRLWLLTTVLLSAYLIWTLFDYPAAWPLGLLALLLSQSLIISAWPEAKFGTLANLLLLGLCLAQWAEASFVAQNEAELKALRTQEQSMPPLRKAEALPPVVARWLQRSGALDRAPIRRARFAQKAWMRLQPKQERWTYAQAEQYSFASFPAFHWQVRLKWLKVLPVYGRDMLHEGRGQMKISLMNLLPVVDASGARIDEGSMQRYLGELVWMPSLALSPHIGWQSTGPLSARARLRQGDLEVQGDFYFNEAGDFIRFECQRYMGEEQGSPRRNWVLSVQEYRDFDGLRLPAKMQATWELPEGRWTWLKLELSEAEFWP